MSAASDIFLPGQPLPLQPPLPSAGYVHLSFHSALSLTLFWVCSSPGTYSRGGLILSGLVGRVEKDGSVRRLKQTTIAKTLTFSFWSQRLGGLHQIPSSNLLDTSAQLSRSSPPSRRLHWGFDKTLTSTTSWLGYRSDHSARSPSGYVGYQRGGRSSNGRRVPGRRQSSGYQV